MLCRMRVYQYYLPIYFWMRRQLSQHKDRLQGKQQPLTIGMQAPQVHPSLLRPTKAASPFSLWTRKFWVRTGVTESLAEGIVGLLLRQHIDRRLLVAIVAERLAYPGLSTHAGLWEDHHCGGARGSIQA